jgi:hypothetical protein
VHYAKRDIAVLISSSPIESHPSTAIIDETLASVRWHLPDSPIIVMLDGVREEQESLHKAYEEYKSKLSKYEVGVKIMDFQTFTHQAGMTIVTLELLRHPQILLLEHDTPLLERPIDWEMLMDSIATLKTNHIRLHYDEQIHSEHQHLMRGKLTPNLIKTVQWHQRPHLADRAWYRRLLHGIFTPDSRCFIEDRVYTFVENAPWEEHKLTIYDPEGTGKTMKRSSHTNGRGSETKYPMVF